MNSAHFHLIVNHLPIIFPMVGIIVLLIGISIKTEVVKRTAYLIFSLGAITTIVAMTSGEGAEDVVEKINGVSENYIKKHEEVAEVFALLSYTLGGLSLFGIWASLKQKKFANIVSMITIMFSCVVLFFAKQTGTTGGEIRHTEIRNGAAINDANNENEKKDDDD